MRSILGLSCMLAIAIAAPQYNYNVPQYSSGSGILVSGGGGGGSGGGFISGGGSYGGSSYGGGINGGAFDSFNPAPALPSSASVAAYHRSRPHHGHRRVLPTIVSKNIYYHAAPEEPDEEIYEDNSSHQARKHYNVVFIKAPHQSVKKIATQTAQALNEERTAIYVLSKNNDIHEIRQAISDVPHHASKPEVFFIKYKTPEEAQHAQQTIQSQYDAIGGTTNISNEGFAPISSVIGLFDGGVGNGGYTGGNGGGGFVGGNIGGGGGGATFITTGDAGGAVSHHATQVAASYLPPSKV